jgi:hypothetical protein
MMRFISIICAALLCGTANAASINHGATNEVNAHSVCRNVSNNSGGNLFIPTNSAAEWQSFYNNPPAGVSLGGCVSHCTGTPWGTVNHGSSVTAWNAWSSCGGCASQTRTCSMGTLSGTYVATSCNNASCAACSLPWGGSIAHGASVTAWNTSASCGGCASQTRTCSNGTLSGSYGSASCNNSSCASCGLPWGGSIGHGSGVTAYAASSVACGNSCASQWRSCSNGSLSGSYGYASCSVASCGGASCNGPLHTYQCSGTELGSQTGGFGSIPGAVNNCRVWCNNAPYSGITCCSYQSTSGKCRVTNGGKVTGTRGIYAEWCTPN